MGFVKCYDAVTMVTDEATRQFSPLLQEDADRKMMLQESCEMIESMANQFNGTAYETNVDRDTMEIAITLTCAEFETDATSSKFYELLERAKKFRLKAVGDDCIEVTFVFDGIWVIAM